MRIENWMTTKVITIRPEAGIRDAIEIMRQHSIRHLPVMSGEKLVGLVSLGNLKQSILASMIEHLRISDVMVRDVHCATLATSLEQAARIMHTRAIGCLPVALDEVGNVMQKKKAFIVTDSFLYKKSTLTYDGGFNSRQLGLDAAPYTADNLQKSREELLSGQAQQLNSMPPMPMQAETMVSSVEIAAPSEQMVMDANGNIDIVGGDKENNAEAAGTKKDEE